MAGMGPGFAVFDTTIGPCGIVWGDAGVRGLHLPGADAERTRAGLRRRHPDAVEAPPPPAVRAAMKDIGLSLEVVDTGSACRIYNVLLAEGRRVAAALIPL